MKQKRTVVLAVTMAAASWLAVFGDGDVVATASPVPVDLRVGGVRGVVGAANLRYSPLWAATNAAVRIETVDGAATNVVKSGAVGEEGCFAWTRPDAAKPLYRLLLWTVRDGVAVGEPLEAMVSFGIVSASGFVTAADTRTNSLALAAWSDAPVSLAYSTAWAEGAASLEIDAVRLSGRGGAPVATNAMFSAAADAEGAAPLRGVGKGWWRLLYRMFDSSGAVALEYLTGEFRRKGGFVVHFQ